MHYPAADEIPQKNSRDFGPDGLVGHDNLIPMKSFASTVYLSAALLAGLVPAFGLAAEEKKSPPAESEVITKARANYPLKTCLVSDEPLGSMGEAVAYVHKSAGKPDRVIFVCCEGCIDDFKADPAKFLKKVDDAGKNKAAPDKKDSDKSAK